MSSALREWAAYVGAILGGAALIALLLAGCRDADGEPFHDPQPDDGGRISKCDISRGERSDCRPVTP